MEEPENEIIVRTVKNTEEYANTSQQNPSPKKTCRCNQEFTCKGKLEHIVIFKEEK